MNKELEAFKRIWAMFDFKDMQYERSLVIKALTPPTADEVCALIEKDIKGKVTYYCGQFYIDNEKVDDILFGVFRAKTLIAIGKFYEE